MPPVIATTGLSSNELWFFSRNPERKEKFVFTKESMSVHYFGGEHCRRGEDSCFTQTAEEFLGKELLQLISLDSEEKARRVREEEEDLKSEIILYRGKLFMQRINDCKGKRPE